MTATIAPTRTAPRQPAGRRAICVIVVQPPRRIFVNRAAEPARRRRIPSSIARRSFCYGNRAALLPRGSGGRRQVGRPPRGDQNREVRSSVLPAIQRPVFLNCWFIFLAFCQFMMPYIIAAEPPITAPVIRPFTIPLFIVQSLLL